MVSVTRKSSRQTTRDAGDVMESRLLAAVERLLETDTNFTALSVERLAREAGISRATFYLYFKDKSDLIERLIRHVEDEVVSAGGMWFEHAEDADYEELKRAMHRFMDAYREHRAVLRAAAETAAYDEDVNEAYQHMMGRFRAETRAAVDRIAASGRAHDGLPTMLADVLSWSVDHCYVWHGARLEGEELDSFVNALTWIVWHTIFADDKP